MLTTKQRFWIVGGEFRCEQRLTGRPQVLGPFKTRAEAKAVRRSLAEATEPRRATALPEDTEWSWASPEPEATELSKARALPEATEV